MQSEIFLVLIPFFISLGVIIGYLLHDELTGVKHVKEDITVHTMQEDDGLHAPFHTPEEESGLISNEGVGIVYRPSQEEIAKMNEPQKVREAKEAIAETLQRETPPTI